MNTSTRNSVTLQPRVYVGTYKKYNEGSIEGGWLTLTDYKDYGAFCAACRKLHRDERDPELMIQDCSDMPDGLSVMEWMSEQEFNDIIEAVHAEAMEEESETPKFSIIDYSDRAIAVVGDTRDIKEQLKKLGGRFNPRLSCGCGWIFSKTKRADVEKLLAAGKVENAKGGKRNTRKSISKELIEEIMTEYAKAWGKDESMMKFCRNEISNAVKLSDGRIVIVKKERLETNFCFGYSTCGQGGEYDEANDMAHHALTRENYFRNENLAPLQNKLDSLRGGGSEYSTEHPYLNQQSYYGVGPINVHEVVSITRRAFEEQKFGTYHEIAEEDKATLIAMYEEEIVKMGKRIDTYLKRYGLSKLHVWTYWQDE